MRGENEIRAILEGVLARSKADQAEVLYLGKDSHLTRFANSTIHQNVSESNAEVRVRAVLGKRVGVASTNDLSPAGLDKVAEAAVTVARFQPEQPDFESLPAPLPIQTVQGYSEATAAYTPEDRAKGVGIICRRAQEAKLSASGAFTTEVSELAVANSLGVRAYHPATEAHLVTVVMSENSSGYGESQAWDVSSFNIEELGDNAVKRAIISKNPTTIEPGRYTVILEEYAVAEIVHYLSYMGFGALAVQEGQSFLTGKLGQVIGDPRITIVDDGSNPLGLPRPFDYEGMPKQRVEIILAGIARAVVYDSYTARKEGKTSTGHALPSPNAMGPYAMNLFMTPGADDKRAMIRSIDRGLWVTRFHYVNPLDRRKAILTGMTRDGTFKIENGEITDPVKNLRFTQSMLEALNQVEKVGRTAKLVDGARVPALVVRDFNFTGVTEF